MVICSCNIVSTDRIRQVIENMSEPTVKKVIFALGWQSQCSTCANNLVNEIRNVMETVR